MIANHYKYCVAVYEQNAKRHNGGSKNGLSLEETWRTDRWANCICVFIMAVSEITAYLTMKYFQDLNMTQIEFWKKLT